MSSNASAVIGLMIAKRKAFTNGLPDSPRQAVASFSICIAQQKIGDAHGKDSLIIASRERIRAQNVLRIVISNFQQTFILMRLSENQKKRHRKSRRNIVYM